MGNVCACCTWGRNSSADKTKKKDMWFEEESVPLVSARHGLDDIGSVQADGTLKRTVLIRSPRLANTSTSDFDKRSGRHQSPRQHHKRLKLASGGDSDSHRHHSSAFISERNEEKSYSKHHSRQGDDDQACFDQRTGRSLSLEVQDSARVIRSSSSLSPRASSPASSSSPKASSNSNSPQTKPRYGRKHYRAKVHHA